jgi:lysophospholipase L1-like esterase
VTRRAQDLILVVLALLAAVTTYLAFANVRGAAPTGDEVVANGGGLTPGGGSPTTQDDGDMADDTADPTEAPEGDAETGAAGASLQAARSALAGDDPVTIAVLGDSTSNERSEWVHLWAEMLAEDRPVTISHWNEADGTSYNGPDILSEDGEGSEVTIWSGSVAGATAASTAELLPGIVPERPDFVIYNFGHNSTVDVVADHFDELHSGIKDVYGDLPTIVILQNPQLDDANADVREAVEAWARANGADVIDVAADWPQAAWPWLVDEVHPSQQGQQFWAETVAAALR